MGGASDFGAPPVYAPPIRCLYLLSSTRRVGSSVAMGSIRMQRVLRLLSVVWMVALAWASGMAGYVALTAAQGGLRNGVEWRDYEVMAAWTGFAWAASFFP